MTSLWDYVQHPFIRLRFKWGSLADVKEIKRKQQLYWFDKFTWKNNSRTYLLECHHKLYWEEYILAARGVHRNDRILWTNVIWGGFIKMAGYKSGFEIVPDRERKNHPQEMW